MQSAWDALRQRKSGTVGTLMLKQMQSAWDALRYIAITNEHPRTGFTIKAGARVLFTAK